MFMECIDGGRIHAHRRRTSAVSVWSPKNRPSEGDVCKHTWFCVAGIPFAFAAEFDCPVPPQKSRDRGDGSLAL